MTEHLDPNSYVGGIGVAVEFLGNKQQAEGKRGNIYHEGFRCLSLRLEKSFQKFHFPSHLILNC